MTPRLVACYFGEGVGQQYPRLARVLEHTARQHCPGWMIAVDQLPAGPLHRSGYAEGEVANVLKMRHWIGAVRQAPDDTGLLLIDGDTVILRPLDPVWTLPFDVAYTVRSRALPFNGGVVFVRTTPAGRAFVDAWMAEAERMFTDRAYHGIFRRKYGGISQAALGAVLESPIAGATTLRPLPCLEWNCEDTSWAAFDPALTRILHLKSALREVVFHVGPSGPAVRALKPLALLWRRLEAEALALPTA